MIPTSPEHSSLTDEEMIRQVLPTQPHQCFESLYERYVGKVYQRCLSMTHDSEKAQDFTQDIFLKVFSKLDAFQQRSSFSTWLYSISYNHCADQLRLAKRLLTTPIEESLPKDIADSSEACLHEEAMQLVAQSIAMLSTKEQALLRLKYVDGLSIKAIADLYALKESAVKMRLKHCREKIRRLHNQLSAS